MRSWFLHAVAVLGNLSQIRATCQLDVTAEQTKQLVPAILVGQTDRDRFETSADDRVVECVQAVGGSDEKDAG